MGMGVMVLVLVQLFLVVAWPPCLHNHCGSTGRC
jgi:hypothetical protein